MANGAALEQTKWDNAINVRDDELAADSSDVVVVDPDFGSAREIDCKEGQKPVEMVGMVAHTGITTPDILGTVNQR